MKIVQIATGGYTYMGFNEGTEKDYVAQSHAIYALDDQGVVYKHNNMKDSWVPLLEKNHRSPQNN